MSRSKRLLRILFVLSFGLIYSLVHAQSTTVPITVDNLNEVEEIHQFTIVEASHIAWSSDGTLFAVDGRTGVTVYITSTWDAEPRNFAHNIETRGVAFSHDGTLLAFIDYDAQIRILNLTTGNQQVVLRGHESLITSIAFNSDDTLLVSGSQDATVRLWTVESGTLRLTLTGSIYNGITNVFFSPDDTWIGASSGSGESTIRMWDVASGTERQGFETNGDANAAALSADGARLASGGFNEIIRVWDFAKHTIIGARHVDGGIECLDFNPDGTLLASGRDSGTVGILGVGVNRSIGLEPDNSPVMDVAFNPDGTMLASVSSDGTIRLWGIPAD